MLDKNSFIDQVVNKTSVKKEDIFALASDLQHKNLQNEEDIRDFIIKVSKVTNKPIDEAKINKITDLIKNNKIPSNIEKML